MPTSCDWSVLVVNYNSSRDLAAAVTSFARVHAKKETWEILIADNASSAPEQKLLSKFIDQNSNKIQIKSYFLNGNLGFGGANNYLAARARGDKLLFLNPDTLTQEELLVHLSADLDVPEVGLVAPQITDRVGVTQPASYGRFPTLARVLGEKFFGARPASASTLQAVDWVSGAAFACRRELFASLGGFDERFFLYFEDVDLCRRVVAGGYQNYRDTRVSVIHLGAERQVVTRARRRAYFAGQEQYFRRWRPAEWLVLRLVRTPYRAYRYLKDPR